MNYNHLNLLQSVILCFFMSFLYVISLYLWSHENRYNRYLPKVVKRRFLSVLSTSFICFIAVYMIGKHDSSDYTFTRWIGLRIDSTLLNACLLPLMLTICLFLGPIIQSIIIRLFVKFHHENDDDDDDYDDGENEGNGTKIHNQQKNSLNFNFLRNIFWWRNYVVSPFTEEFVFRSCMIPLLVHNLHAKLTIFLTPLYFGVAHLHHIIESLWLNHTQKQYNNLKIILFEHFFQFFYTYLFGIYSSFLFLRCANLLPCFLCHAFCNYMGFPSVGEIFYYKELNKYYLKYLIIITYFFGLFLFIYLIMYMTQPSFYDNQIYNKYF